VLPIHRRRHWRRPANQLANSVSHPTLTLVSPRLPPAAAAQVFDLLNQLVGRSVGRSVLTNSRLPCPCIHFSFRWSAVAVVGGPAIKLFANSLSFLWPVSNNNHNPPAHPFLFSSCSPQNRIFPVVGNSYTLLPLCSFVLALPIADSAGDLSRGTRVAVDL